ncbi:hypothetical protein RD792_007290 [Penstemon davidsonii]|uniref:Homeobox-leucine zipper protein n=1 Tax=Penstemon davidsonii TaxID=160366 RepID=A0ABR0D600_9LAMI|nr:hypothetical protein RD792_007290 [Penstemon davidsonii]
MNLLNSENQIKHHPSSKHQKKRLNQDQVQLLEASFDGSKKLEPERKFQLARELNVPPRQIAIWYQNKRARWKNQSLELDYGALQVKLEATLTEKRELQKEVDYLKTELKQVQDMLLGFKQAQAQARVSVAPPVSSLSSYCEDGSSLNNINDDREMVRSCSGNWGINNNESEALKFEELYTCMMMGAATAKGSTCGSIPNASLNNERDFWV